MLFFSNCSDFSIIGLWTLSIGLFGSIGILFGEITGLFLVYLPIVYFGLFEGLYTTISIVAVIHGLIHDLYPFINTKNGFDFNIDQSIDMLAHTAMLIVSLNHTKMNYY